MLRSCCPRFYSARTNPNPGSPTPLQTASTTAVRQHPQTKIQCTDEDISKLRSIKEKLEIIAKYPGTQDITNLTYQVSNIIRYAENNSMQLIKEELDPVLEEFKNTLQPKIEFSPKYFQARIGHKNRLINAISSWETNLNNNRRGPQFYVYDSYKLLTRIFNAVQDGLNSVKTITNTKKKCDYLKKNNNKSNKTYNTIKIPLTTSRHCS